MITMFVARILRVLLVAVIATAPAASFALPIMTIAQDMPAATSTIAMADHGSKGDCTRCAAHATDKSIVMTSCSAMCLATAFLPAAIVFSDLRRDATWVASPTQTLAGVAAGLEPYPPKSFS